MCASDNSTRSLKKFMNECKHMDVNDLMEWRDHKQPLDAGNLADDPGELPDGMLPWGGSPEEPAEPILDEGLSPPQKADLQRVL
ncbi:UNVERIFIED_CONTAM: hypothetical protein K2H54_048732 [Gekko kuhli]